MKRNTTWDSISVEYPFDITGKTFEIDFKDYSTGTVVKRITSNGVSPNSYILVDLDIRKIYPIISATDSLLFQVDKLYIFDIVAVDGADVRRSPTIQLYADPAVTAVT